MDDKWAEHQIIAAARGLPVPPADQPPPDDLIPRLPSPESPAVSTQNLNNLTIPITGRSQSAASEHSTSNSLSAVTSPVSAGPIRASSPFRPRGKALAAVLGGTSRNGSTTDIAPREITLPHDPFVNGQPLEVFLYKDAIDCPICFLAYPPFLNHTRCCDQPICSECFVQIKRPDPHYPEGHNEDDPNHDPEETAGMLVSEPACCPYCTQPEFGVTYEPPPFRRGLTYATPHSGLGSLYTATSSTSSLNSATVSPTPGSPIGTANRRRTQSLSAHAPNVIPTDRIRPDWSTKLQAARAHQARRAAAATALHTAAFLMGGNETRPFRVSRFGRRNTGASGSGSAGGEAGDNGGSGTVTPSQSGSEPAARTASGRGLLVAGTGSGNRGRNRMDDLEDMMFMEAVRLSLAAEEDRKRKAEKEERKEAKRREKEERKAAKAAAKHGPGPYGSGGGGRSGNSSASGSTLSLPGLSFGRKRGNSGASNLRADASVANAMASTSGAENPMANANNTRDKGKGVDRGLQSTPEGGDEAAEPTTASSSTASRTALASRPIPTQHQSAGPSHLRQMSNASSVSSSLPDSRPGSFTPASHLLDPRASGLSLGSRSGASEDGGDHDRERDPSASTEPMFNFRSLAEVVGVTLEGEHAGRRLSRIGAEQKASESAAAAESGHAEAGEASKGAETERVGGSCGHSDDAEHTSESLKPQGSTINESHGFQQDSPPPDSSHLTPPRVMITPETPGCNEGDESKQLGCETTVEPLLHQVAQ